CTSLKTAPVLFGELAVGIKLDGIRPQPLCRLVERRYRILRAVPIHLVTKRDIKPAVPKPREGGVDFARIEVTKDLLNHAGDIARTLRLTNAFGLVPVDREQSANTTQRRCDHCTMPGSPILAPTIACASSASAAMWRCCPRSG